MNSTKVEEGRERAKPSAERRSNSQRIEQQLKPNLQAYKTQTLMWKWGRKRVREGSTT
jgi:hypothetical protein